MWRIIKLKRIFSNILVVALTVGNVFFGFPVDVVIHKINESKIVDNLYWAMQDSDVIDRGVIAIPTVVKRAHADSTIAYKSAGAGTMTETGSADLAPAAPATVDAGDILIAHIVVLDSFSSLPTIPTGWTLLFGASDLGTGIPTGRAWVYGRIADGSEDGAAINFGSLAGTAGRMGRIYSFSGYESGSITDVVPAASFSENSSETDPIIQSVTTTIPGAKAVALVSQDDDNSHNALGAVSGGTWAEPVADYVDANVSIQGGKLQIQVGTPSSDPGTIAGGTVAGTDDEANTLNFEIRSNPAHIALTGTVTGSIIETDIVSGGETIILTSTGSNYVSDTIGTIALDAAKNSGNNAATPTSPWSVWRPTLATGDMLLMFIGWDDSVNNTGISVANGPNGETWQQIGSVVASASTEARMTAYYVVATGAWNGEAIAVTPNANEQWTATVVKLRAGEFDASTPIGASATRASAGVAETSVLMPAFSAGLTDGGGKLIWAGVADDDPQTTLAGGYTSVESLDRGVLSVSVQTRDAAVTNSESLSGGTRAIASDSWASVAFIIRPPTATLFSGVRQGIINGLDSAQSEGTGWDAVVKAGQNVTGVVRTSSTVVTITLDAFGSYDITAQETITATLPATALIDRTSIVASPTFTVADSSGGVAPTVTTDYASNIGATSARFHGSITDDGGDSITQHGFAYSTNSTLSSSVSTTTLGAGSEGAFQEFVSGLSNNQTYYFRAYAISSGGTGYGSILNTTSGNTTPTRSVRLFGGQKIKFFGGTNMIIYPR